MKTLQVILTIDVTLDQYSTLLNKQAVIESLVHQMIVYRDSTLSFDYPAVIIPALATDE